MSWFWTPRRIPLYQIRTEIKFTQTDFPEKSYMAPCIPDNSCCVFDAGFLRGLPTDSEKGVDIFVRNVGWLSPDYTALYIPGEITVYSHRCKKFKSRQFIIVPKKKRKRNVIRLYGVYNLRTEDRCAWLTYLQLLSRLLFCAAEAVNKMEFMVNLMINEKNLDRRILRNVLLSRITKNKINGRKIPTVLHVRLHKSNLVSYRNGGKGGDAIQLCICIVIV
jgi:hypothetical protein